MKSFKEIKVIEVFCCKCGKRFNTEFEYLELFKTKREAKQNLIENDWVVKGNDATCDECVSNKKPIT